MRPDRLARLHRAVDAKAGERVRIIPRGRGGIFVGAADPTRPAVEIDAVVAEVPTAVRTHGNATNSGHNAELSAGLFTVKYSTAALPYELQKSDRVELLERDNRAMKVATTEPFGTGRTIARLEPVATPAPSP